MVKSSAPHPVRGHRTVQWRSQGRLQNCLAKALCCTSICCLLYSLSVFLFIWQQAADDVDESKQSIKGKYERWGHRGQEDTPGVLERDDDSFLANSNASHTVQPSPRGSGSSAQRYRLVMCSKVSAETPYLIEWIEFHRLQGFDKFVLYHDAIPDEKVTVAPALALQWLPKLYESAGTPNLVEVLPAALLIPDLVAAISSIPHNTYITHRLLQPALVAHCVEQYKSRADYIAHLDVDEFLYSPNHASALDYLDSMAKAVLPKYADLREVGYYVRSAQFASTGQFWDFHGFWAPDPANGETNLYFEPRDSTLFRYLWEKVGKTNETFHVGRPDFQIALDEYRAQRADWVKGVPLTAKSFFQFAKKRLQADFSKSTDIYNELPPALQEKANSTVGDLRAYVDSSKDRLRLYAELRRQWMQFYPLIIEEQTFRGPASNTLLDDVKMGAETAHKLFPICALTSVTAKQEFLASQGVAKKTIVELGSFYNSLCNGRPPGMITTSGKAIYRTSAMQRSHQSRVAGRLRGCFRPGVHVCAHRIYGGALKTADPRTELRIDHHQFRSFERRTFGLPKWRGGPLGYAQSVANYSALQEYYGAVHDTNKTKFIPALRQRIAALHPMPKFFDYTMTLTDNGFRLETHNIAVTCSLLELLGERQVMCPDTHPYVGIRMTDVPPPNPFGPYTWCTNMPQSIRNATAWADPVRVAKYLKGEDFPLSKSKSSTSAEAVPQNYSVMMCPGYPETACCDHSPSLLQYQTLHVSPNNAVWRGKAYT